jgi:hypothetical protein
MRNTKVVVAVAGSHAQAGFGSAEQVVVRAGMSLMAIHAGDSHMGAPFYGVAVANVTDLAYLVIGYSRECDPIGIPIMTNHAIFVGFHKVFRLASKEA